MTVISRARRLAPIGLATVALSTGLALAGPAGSATATTSTSTARNGVCEPGEFCLYYGYNLSGSVSDFSGSVSNYGSTQPSCYDFRTFGAAGYRECVKNNAESVWNRTGYTVRVFYNSYFGGAGQSFSGSSDLRV